MCVASNPHSLKVWFGGPQVGSPYLDWRESWLAGWPCAWTTVTLRRDGLGEPFTLGLSCLLQAHTPPAWGLGSFYDLRDNWERHWPSVNVETGSQGGKASSQNHQANQR